MPKKLNLTLEQEAADRAAMAGFPDDGDEFREAPLESSPPAPSPAPPPADPIADMRARLDRQDRELENMRRLIPPAAPKPSPTDPQDEFDSVDWDKELFANPKEALKKAVNIASKQTENRLRSEYQRDSGTREFWNKFYSKHPDLRDDHDLVEVTLNSNLATLANIRVDDAYDKLVELTRDRILRYAGGAARQRSPKARAEGGAGIPASPPPAPLKQEDNVTSISSLIRARRQRRRAGAA